MADLPAPVVTEVDFSDKGLTDIRKKSKGKHVELLLEYPTVYIVYDEEKPHAYQVYVGETNNIEQRTREHLENDPLRREDWRYLADSQSSQLLVIGHPHFNKSLTLDIENNMMLYMSGVKSVKRLNNRRENQQNKYYTVDEKGEIFSAIWQKLHTFDADLFPIEEIVRDSALFKASPFHTLTKEQDNARELILRRIQAALHAPKGHQLILVEGEAGSGKTVLLSTLFYQLWQLGEDLNYSEYNTANNYLLVNHDEQVKVYKNIAEKLGMNKEKVSRPTTFITNTQPAEGVDVVLVDEAHLLRTQGKQSYRGKNQLDDILARAKVVVAVFDKKQILSREGYLTNNEIHKLEIQSGNQGNLIKFKQQLRINANEDTQTWLNSLIDRRVVDKIPVDNEYEVKIFDDPLAMYHAIQKKAESQEHGLSRMLATFDWPFNKSSKKKDGKPYCVTVGDLSLPWNLQLDPPKSQRGQKKRLAWAEQDQTIGEVGSTFTIQGFDLNYSGVIIGPSVKFREGHIVFDPGASENSKATKRRTLASGEKVFVADELLPNELNVLLTRGVHGLYIYAVDDALRAALLGAQS